MYGIAYESRTKFQLMPLHEQRSTCRDLPIGRHRNLYTGQITVDQGYTQHAFYSGRRILSQRTHILLFQFSSHETQFKGLSTNCSMFITQWADLQAQEAAEKKKRDEEAAAAAAAQLEEIAKSQEAVANAQKKNNLLQGSRMALGATGAKQKPAVASQKKAVDKVSHLHHTCILNNCTTCQITNTSTQIVCTKRSISWSFHWQDTRADLQGDMFHMHKACLMETLHAWIGSVHSVS